MKKQLKVGQIVNTHGIKGEFRVYPLTDYKERFEELEWIYMDGHGDEKFYIQKVKYKNDMVLLKLKEIDDMNEAEKYKSKYLTIAKENARELPEDTYLIVDLIGMEVYSEENECIGTVKDVIQNAGNDLYEIIDHKNPKKLILIPAVAEFIKKVDIENRVIIVKLIEGMIE